MFNLKICLAATALLGLSFAIGQATATCEGCTGDAMIAAVDKYAKGRECVFNAKPVYLLQMKLEALAALFENFLVAHQYNNAHVADECKTEFNLKTCDTTDIHTVSKCYMDNVRRQAVNHRDQEICNGGPIPSDTLTLAMGLIFGSFAGLHELHPHCF